MGPEPSQIRQEIEETRSEMGDTVDALAYKSDVKTRVKESVSDKRDRFVEQIKGTSHKVGEATPDGEQLKSGAHQAVGIAEENPLGLALAGIAGGFLVGMLLPSTRVEDERVGPLADHVKETAAETGQEALERGKQVAKEAGQEAVETAKEAGREQAEELKSSVEEGAEEVSERARTGQQSGSSQPDGAGRGDDLLVVRGHQAGRESFGDLRVRLDDRFPDRRPRLVGERFVEVGADGATCLGLRQGVAAGAAVVREDLCPPRGGGCSRCEDALSGWRRCLRPCRCRSQPSAPRQRPCRGPARPPLSSQPAQAGGRSRSSR